MTHLIQEYHCPVLINAEVAPGYWHMVLHAPQTVLAAQPGQFFNVLCPPDEDVAPFFRRPFSIYRLDEREQQLHFLYKVVGAGTRAMTNLQNGDKLNILGPLGQGFWLRAEWKTLLVVARGVGVATLAPLVQVTRAQKRRVIVLNSARTPEVLLASDDLRALGATVHEVTDSNGSSAMPEVEKILRHIIEQEQVDALFTCGSWRMLRLLQKLGKVYALPGQAALEQQMACGVGVCHGCVLPFRRDGQIVDLRVCKDGPVFDLHEVVA